MTKPFTAENILEVKTNSFDGDMLKTIRYHIGNTDSDRGLVVLTLISIQDEDEPNQYDVEVTIDGDINWGLGACASALAVVAADFPTRFPDLKITDNTGL